jgi:hypothetical protein
MEALESLWSIQAPNKMKIVLWHLAHDCLPTGYQLMHHQIPADVGCVFCGTTERVEHLFLQCPFAISVWRGVKEEFPCKLRKNDVVNTKQWLFELLVWESATTARSWRSPADTYGRRETMLGIIKDVCIP